MPAIALPPFPLSASTPSTSSHPHFHPHPPPSSVTAAHHPNCAGHCSMADKRKIKGKRNESRLRCRIKEKKSNKIERK